MFWTDIWKTYLHTKRWFYSPYFVWGLFTLPHGTRCKVHSAECRVQSMGVECSMYHVCCRVYGVEYNDMMLCVGCRPQCVGSRLWGCRVQRVECRVQIVRCKAKHSRCVVAPSLTHWIFQAPLSVCPPPLPTAATKQGRQHFEDSSLLVIFLLLYWCIYAWRNIKLQEIIQLLACLNFIIN